MKEVYQCAGLEPIWGKQGAACQLCLLPMTSCPCLSSLDVEDSWPEVLSPHIVLVDTVYDKLFRFMVPTSQLPERKVKQGVGGGRDQCPGSWGGL